jgi:hypothetical protein
MPAFLAAFRVSFKCAVLMIVLAMASPARAQEPTDGAEPAHIAYVDGVVTLIRDGLTETVDVNIPVVVGDHVTTSAGRVEILFPDGTALDIDESTDVEFLAPNLLRLLSGRALLTVPGINQPAGTPSYQIDTPVASVRVEGTGDYKITVLGASDGNRTELAVSRGFATLLTERGSTVVRAGERIAAIENGSVSYPQPFNSARFDTFDHWVAERREARVGARSAQYLPSDLRIYAGSLDRNGSWEYDASYGYVWYPSVPAGWQPYYNGYWSPMPTYGWTWIGLDGWSWPTHHYGRWGYGRNSSWFWIPGRTWGPAWVSWGSAPGYVSWCPLGFDGRPVFGLPVGATSSWRGWVVVPHTSFGVTGHSASRYAIAPHRIPRTTTFSVHSAAPVAVRSSLRGTSMIGNSNAGVPRRAVPRPSIDQPGTPGVVRRRPNRSSPALPGAPEDPAVNGWRRSLPVESAPSPASAESPAVRRAGQDRAISGREFRRPFPDSSWTSSDRTAPVQAVPTTPNAIPWNRAPRGTQSTLTGQRLPPVVGGQPQAAPAPQAVPRWVPHNNNESQLPRAMPFPSSVPPSGVPAVPPLPHPSLRATPQPENVPAPSGLRYRQTPAGSQTPDRGQGYSGNGGGSGRPERAAPNQPAPNQPAATGSPTQAVPRSTEGRPSGGEHGTGRRR